MAKDESTQGKFTKEEADITEASFTSIFEALSRNKRFGFIYEANGIYLFLEAAKAAAPAKTAAPAKST